MLCYRDILCSYTAGLIATVCFFSSHENNNWGPGLTLPVNSHQLEDSQQAPRPHHYGESGMNIEALFAGLQNAIDNKTTVMCDKIDKVVDRLQTIESRQKKLEEVKSNAASSKSVASSPASLTPGRKCHTPVALQVTRLRLA